MDKISHKLPLLDGEATTIDFLTTDFDASLAAGLAAGVGTTLNAGFETGSVGVGLDTTLLVGFHDGLLDNVATEDSSSGNDDGLEVWSCGVLELISWSWTAPCVFFVYLFLQYG